MSRKVRLSWPCNLLGKAIRTLFGSYFPNPEDIKKKKQKNPYQPILDWFGKGHTIDLLNDKDDETYWRALYTVPELAKLVDKHQPGLAGADKKFMMEFLLHGLAEYSLLSKTIVHGGGFQFKDLFNSVFTFTGKEEDEEDDY